MSRHLVILTRAFLLLIDWKLSLLRLFLERVEDSRVIQHCRIISAIVIIVFYFTPFLQEPKLAFPVIHVKLTIQMVDCFVDLYELILQEDSPCATKPWTKDLELSNKTKFNIKEREI